MGACPLTKIWPCWKPKPGRGSNKIKLCHWCSSHLLALITDLLQPARVDKPCAMLKATVGRQLPARKEVGQGSFKAL